MDLSFKGKCKNKNVEIITFLYHEDFQINASWMAVNGEGVYGTRPWKVFGEGPVTEVVIPLKGQEFNEGKH